MAVSNWENVIYFTFEPAIHVLQKVIISYKNKSFAFLYGIPAGLVTVYRHNMNNNKMRFLQQYDSGHGYIIDFRILIGEYKIHRFAFRFELDHTVHTILTLVAVMHKIIFILF